MTNRQYIIELLSNESCIDDDGKSYEAMIYHRINCPYYRDDKRCHCKDLDTWEFVARSMCFECKQEWLESEVEDNPYDE